MLSSGKQVFLYFLEIPIDPSILNTKEYEKVKEFKEKYRDRGIYCIVKNEDELRKVLTNHLIKHFLPLMTGEKNVNEKSKSPILKIRDVVLDEFNKAIVRHSQFFECKDLLEKPKSIIQKILLLKKEYLHGRDRSNVEKLPLTQIDKELMRQIMEDSVNQLIDADIPEEWKSTIINFSAKYGIEIEAQFWNVGNLKKKYSLGLFGRETVFEGNESEKTRYEKIQDIYFEIRDYEICNTFFSSVDSQGYVKLVLTNIGDTFDEDVHVKLIIKKGCVFKPKDFPAPDKSIIKKILKKNLLYNAFIIGKSDTIDSYSGYPEQLPHYNNRILNLFDGVSDQEQYEQQFIDNLKHIFCYKYFSRDDYDILKFHVNYLKHNTTMAFPSILIFKEFPEFIEYEITSRYIPNIVKGKIEISDDSTIILIHSQN